MEVADEPLKCTRCLLPYDDIRIPKLLHCRHTFCVNCLGDLLDRGKITCSHCYKLTNIGSYDLRDALETADVSPCSNLKSSLQKQSTPSDKPSDPGALHDFWCLVCSCIASHECRGLKHEMCSLSSEEGIELAESYLKTLMITCKLHWNSASNKRREVNIKLKNVLTSLKSLEREIEQVAAKNRNELQCTEFLLEEVVNVLNSKGKKSVSDFHSQINKYSHLSRGAKLYAEEAVADLEHANAVSQCLINTTTASGSEDAFVTPESALSGESSVCTHLKPSPVAPGVVPEKVECSELKTIATLDTCPKEGECQWVPLMKNNEESTMENSLGIMQINKEQQSPEVLSEDRLSKSKLSDSSKDGVTRSVSSRSLNYKNPQSSYKKNTEKFTLLKPPVVPIPHKKCFLHFAVNDEPIGRIVIMLDVQIAPELCRKFYRHCVHKYGYTGSNISKRIRNVYIMGGTILGEDRLFEAPTSPLTKTRGAVYFSHRRNYLEYCRNIVRTEFGIQLAPETPDTDWASTVFGYVTEGLDLCDYMSRIICSRKQVVITRAGAI